MTASAGISYFDDGATTMPTAAIEAKPVEPVQHLRQLRQLRRRRRGLELDTNDPHVLAPHPTATADASVVADGHLRPNERAGLRDQTWTTRPVRTSSSGANYYVDGHAMKYIINWTSVGSDNGDTDPIRIGVNAAF